VNDAKPERLTYGAYLSVAQLTSLQNPLAQPSVRGEMFFIIGQQVQELWFKQILYDLTEFIRLADTGYLYEAVRLLDRVNRIVSVLAQETELLQTLPPSEFKAFRPILSTASGFESEQFRALEWVSGLRDANAKRLLLHLNGGAGIMARWPRSLRDVLCGNVTSLDGDPVSAIEFLYNGTIHRPELLALVDALSEYEIRFAEWRFHHIKVVERVIGNRAPGTGGSSGSGYLGRTLEYRFFPELWEARNRISAATTPPIPAAEALALDKLSHNRQ
jgi:tryptophan 2,3-dioxygenase